MFLIRTAFWLSIAILFIPAGPDTDSAPQAGPISASQALGAAQSIWIDLAGFCQRNTAVCETGGAVAGTFTSKARNGARILYQYLDGDSVGVDGPGLPEGQDVKLNDGTATPPSMTTVVYRTAPSN